MNASGAVDLAVSLAFVYMLLSLMCTSSSELIASVLALRQKNLSLALGHLLGHTSLRKAFYAHPLIKGIAHGRTGEPSYIPKDLFSAAVVDLLAKEPAPNADHTQLKEGLVALLRGTDAEAAVKDGFDKLGAATNTVKTALGTWFDDSMSRASGAYKRKAQLMVFIVATVLVVGTNADTVAISKALWVRPELRTAIADQAGKYVAQGMPASASSPTDADKALEETNKRLTDTTDELLGLGLPLGWTDDVLRPGETIPSKFMGLLLTILACSLGAPFWFDLLGKLVNIRGTSKNSASRKA